ncbi:MAG: sulfurtransferase [Moraxellaceae bacterium]|nr:sulfurtransferase [Moraxellaceae bacterium]
MKSPLELVAEAKAEINEVSLEQAQEVCDKADVVIDVREPSEYAVGHLPNAINIPRGVLEFKLADTVADIQADSNIVLYCKTSGRSALATQSLMKLGYSNVSSIIGGFDAWVEAGKPVVKPTDVNYG